MKPILVLLIGLFILGISPRLAAQNDLSVSYTTNGVPDLLNICGKPDTARVSISTSGLNTSDRTDIVANVTLAGGIRVVGLIDAESTSGVQLSGGLNTGIAQFSLPDLAPNATSEAIITFLVKADCSINDSLAQNANYDLMDTWVVDYTLNGNNNQINTTLNSYRAAIRIPELLINPEAVAQKVKVGDCITRTVTINNTSLEAYLLDINYSILAKESLSYKAIRVNGTDVSFVKTANASGDTLISVDIPGSFFIDNTLNGGASNADTLFDTNEQVTIEEDLCVVNCIDDFTTTHRTSYGCFGNTCVVYSKNTTLDPGQGNISITFETDTDAAQQNVGYCKQGISAIKITNTGVSIDPGFADMYNIAAGIGMGLSAALTDNGYVITNLSIQGVSINSLDIIKQLDGNADFMVDPDGASGLADLDGDGYFDDLPEGQSIEIVIEYDFSCTDAGLINLQTTCDTAFSTRLSAFFEYDNACSSRISESRTNYHTIMNQKVIHENYVTPDIDAGNGELFYITHAHDRRVFNFDKGCANGNLYAQIILPTGIQLDTDSTTLIRNDALNHTLVSSTQSNDTLLVKFDPGPFELLNGAYDLSLAFTADCSAQDGQTNFVIEFGFMCEDCNCKHSWYCDNITGTYVHVKNPPCPTAPTCDNAIRTDAMDMSRITFGFTDTTYTVLIDPASANTKNGLNCDSMLLSLEGLAGNSYNGTDVGIDISYSNPLFQEGTEDVFIYGRGYLAIKHAGVLTTCEIPTSSLTTTRVDSEKFLDFDLQTSLQACGVSVQADDTVRAYLYFTVNDEGPFPNNFYLVPELRAGYYVNNASKITCGNYGDEIKVGKNRTFVVGPTNSTQPSGCDTTVLEYKIIPMNNGYTNTNPSEHRPAVAIDSVTFDYEPFLLNGFADVKVQASIIDHPSHGDAFYDIGILDNSGHFVATFDTITQFPSMLKILDYAISIRFLAIPKCETNTGSFNGDNVYDFDANIFYKKNYHSFNISNGACVVDTIYNNSSDISYSNPPEISLENLGSPTSDAVNDIFEWTIRQCNSTNYADANVSWLSIEDISPSINIISIEDITDAANIQTLTVNNIPTGGFIVNTNGLDRAIATNSPDDICNIIRIQAQLSDCGTTNANIYTGWNCTATDPLTHPFCQKTSLPVVARSISPQLSIIQSNNQNSYPFCDTIPSEYIIKNTQLGRDYDMNIEFTLPPNLVFIAGSMEIAWPPSAGFLALGSEPTYVSSSIYGDIYTFTPYTPYPYLTNNGLPQVSTTSITDSNEIAIRYKVLSDCGFTSGRSSNMYVSGNEFCGAPTDTIGFTTFPFFIDGSEPDPANKIQITPSISDTIIGQFPVNVIITNIGDSITGPNDKLKIMLSEGISYVPNSATASGWTPGEPIISATNGITTLVWNLPEGMSKTMTESFDFDLSSFALGCETNDFEVGFLAVREQEQLCVATGSNCIVDIITSGLQVLDIHKDGSPIITIGSSVSDTLCAGLPVDLVAIGGDDITWIAQPSGDTIGVGNPFILTPDLSLTGIVASATSDTCSISSDTMNIFVLDAPTITLLPQDTTINEGDTILINGVLTTNIPTTLQWNPTVGLSDTTIVNPLAFPEDSTLFILHATGNTGCVAIDSININVIPKIDTVPCPIFNISEDTVNYMVVCGLDAYFPLSIDFDSLFHYKISVDGIPSNDIITTHIDPIGTYDISGMMIASGPFDYNWNFKDSIYTGTAYNVNQLLNEMAAIDSFGNWFFDENNEILWGGISFYTYQDLMITNNTDFSITVPFAISSQYGQSLIPLSFGTHEIIVFDSTGICADTVVVNTSCQRFSPNSNTGICNSESIYIDQKMIYCIDTLTLPGTIVSLSDICASIDTGAVEYILNDSTFCMDYKGLSIGNDTACIVICDDLGLCDTINFCTSVVPYNGFPIANDDSLCVFMNTPRVFDILVNDTTWGGIDTLYFVNESLNGELTLNLDYTVTYIPDFDICERTERLQYIVCNSNGCDDAFIDICIKCDDIVVFTAVSPNGDGVNDVFYIANIENYPNNVVEVYNRWGNRVFNETGYLNTWNGYWIDDKIIPDGTYYYVIKLNDKSKRTFKGYLEIRR